MSRRSLLKASSSLGGVNHYWETDSDGNSYVVSVQDVSAILEQNKTRQNDGTGGWNQARDGRSAGFIPTNILQKWADEIGVPFHELFEPEYEPFITRKLNDPDWRYLRTATWVI